MKIAINFFYLLANSYRATMRIMRGRAKKKEHGLCTNVTWFQWFFFMHIFSSTTFLYFSYRLETLTYNAHTLYLNQHLRQSTSIYLNYFFLQFLFKWKLAKTAQKSPVATLLEISRHSFPSPCHIPLRWSVPFCSFTYALYTLATILLPMLFMFSNMPFLL